MDANELLKALTALIDCCAEEDENLALIARDNKGNVYEVVDLAFGLKSRDVTIEIYKEN